MSNKHSNSLGRHEKLKSRKQIDILFKQRRFFTQPPIRMFYYIEKRTELLSSSTDQTLQTGPDTGNISGGTAGKSKATEKAKDLCLKAGFSASKRYFKHASKRNRVKRLMREVYRTHKQSLAAVAALHEYQISLFFLYGHHELPTLKQVEEKLCPLLQQLEAQLSAH